MKHLIRIAVALMLGAAIISFNTFAPPSEHYIRSRVVKLVGEFSGSCSGEQIRAPSGQDYILSAAHCLSLATNGSIKVITENGKELMRRIIAEDTRSDLLLIEGLPNLPGLKIADSNKTGDMVRTFTHGKGLSTYKTEGEILVPIRIEVVIDQVEDDEVAAKCSMPKLKHVKVFDLWSMRVIGLCLLSVDEVPSTAKVVPGSSGGLVVDSRGRVTGVVSAGDSFGFGYFVSLSDIKAFLANY